MRLDTSQQMRTEMRLRMAPRMIQSMEILQLPIMALQERIEQEIQENPVLDLQEEDLDLPDEQALLDQRNRDWTRQIQAMLGENKTFFVAVGMAHLVGANGVPALLRAQGIKVDGP